MEMDPLLRRKYPLAPVKQFIIGARDVISWAWTTVQYQHQMRMSLQQDKGLV
ncbi:hypothetical protein DPMN_091893 [Dreissena polymorpha]|uniref:Uncharacterized protein n=1 Tax=Dreissena polymorpha TaxID=45954 RepID=A0A9D4L0Z8_DREPO|nr:hypothetical protein DPMN_091893 [Dreissena polymorpha]